MKTITALEAVMEIRLALLRGEKVNQYHHARSHVNAIMPGLLKWMEGGIPRSDIITSVVMATGVKRTIAADVVCKVLKKSGYVQKVIDDDDEDEIPADIDRPTVIKEVKGEVSGKGLVKQKAKPSPVAAPVSASPVVPVVAAQVATVVAPVADHVLPIAAAEISAESQLQKEPSPPGKWDHLRKDIIIGKGFIGEESKWMTPEEIQADKERRARIEVTSIASGKTDWKKK